MTRPAIARIDRSPARGVLRAAAAAALVLALGACADRVTQTGSLYPHDHRERHPIALVDAPTTLDVMVRGTGLDARQRDDVVAFATDYQRHGSGALHVQVPAGGDEIGTRRTLEGIRHAVASAGLPTRHLSVSTYPAARGEIASAIRLSFRKLQAQVQSKCGTWPQDLGVSDAAFGLRNEPYWNLGCAMQNNIAAQTADPIDLVRARTAEGGDAATRVRALDARREGADPSTNWPPLRSTR